MRKNNKTALLFAVPYMWKNGFTPFSIVFLLGVLLLLGACKSNKAVNFQEGGSVVVSDEGWINSDTYRMTVYGQWDRSRYYVEGENEEVGKTAKPLFGLREDAKIAAKVKAMRNFKEKMLAYVASETRVENSSLINDIIDSSLSGVIVAPQSVTETYSARHDASIVFHFTAKGLKSTMDAAVQDTLAASREN